MIQVDGDFLGAKLMLFLGGRLLVIRRDRRDDIPWPGYLDFPGGGREGTETAEACALRETHEEVGLVVAPQGLVWRHGSRREGGLNWFFAAHLPGDQARDIRFGSEGSGWALMAAQEFAGRDDAIPHFRDILQMYLREAGDQARTRQVFQVRPRDGA